MNNVIGTVSVRNVVVILALAGALAIAGYTAQALLRAQPDFGLSIESGSLDDEGAATESKADTLEDASSVSRVWSPDEIGTGSPFIVVAGESAFAAGEDYMSTGRYLERERELGATFESAEHPSIREFILQKLTTNQADDAPVGFGWQGNGCEASPLSGLQPC